MIIIATRPLNNKSKYFLIDNKQCERSHKEEYESCNKCKIISDPFNDIEAAYNELEKRLHDEQNRNTN